MSVLKLCQSAKVIVDHVAETTNLKLSWTSVTTSDSPTKKDSVLWPRWFPAPVLTLWRRHTACDDVHYKLKTEANLCALHIFLSWWKYALKAAFLKGSETLLKLAARRDSVAYFSFLRWSAFQRPELAQYIIPHDSWKHVHCSFHNSFDYGFWSPVSMWFLWITPEPS